MKQQGVVVRPCPVPPRLGQFLEDHIMEMSALVKNESNSPEDLSAVHIGFSCFRFFWCVFSLVRWNFPREKGSDFQKWEPAAAEKRIKNSDRYDFGTLFWAERFARSTGGRPPVLGDGGDFRGKSVRVSART